MRDFVEKRRSKSSIGFIGTFDEIQIHYQKKFCIDHNCDINKYHWVRGIFNNVRVRYIKCLGKYPPYAFNEKWLGDEFRVYNSSSSTQMVCSTGGHYSPDKDHLFKIISDNRRVMKGDDNLPREHTETIINDSVYRNHWYIVPWYASMTEENELFWWLSPSNRKLHEEQRLTTMLEE